MSIVSDKKNVWGYARVSSKDQKEDRQIYALIEEGVPLEHIYIDKQSGKDFERTEYKEINEKAEW